VIIRNQINLYAVIRISEHMFFLECFT